MKEVIVIREDSHGTVGVAETLNGVFKCLYDGGWLYDGLEIWEEGSEEFVALIQTFGLNWNLKLEEKIKTINNFNDFFEGCFYLEKFRLY